MGLSPKLQPEDTQGRRTEHLLQSVTSAWQLPAPGSGNETSHWRKKERKISPHGVRLKTFNRGHRKWLYITRSLLPAPAPSFCVPVCPKGDRQRAPLLHSSFRIFRFISFPNINAPCLFSAGQ